jgi:hypothetical protein
MVHHQKKKDRIAYQAKRSFFLRKYDGGAGGNRTHDLLNAILEGRQQNDQLNMIIKLDLFAAKPIWNSPSHVVRKARNVVDFAWRRGKSGHIADTKNQL